MTKVKYLLKQESDAFGMDAGDASFAGIFYNFFLASFLFPFTVSFSFSSLVFII